jgi:predicted RNA-binding Zn-ribbon protein involved in translation (DUF1610 family)
MDTNKDRFPLLRKVLKAIGLPAEAVDDIVERILDWLSTKDTPVVGFSALPFKLRDDFLSPAEVSFYQILRTAVGERALVFTKVNLADLFFVATGDHRQNRALANRVDRKHVDFLVCDLKTVHPIVALELDDQSHQRADRKTRDEIVDGVFAAAGLPLLRIPAKLGYAPQEIQTRLQPYLKTAAPAIYAGVAKTIVPDDSKYAPPSSPTSPNPDPVIIPSASSPACPKCGAVMLQRTAKTGSNAGGKFWGCPNFPRCRTTLGLAG